MFTALSLGAGIQSSAIALMSERGDLPRLDCAIFADTHNEPAAVMAYLDQLASRVSFPIYRVSQGDLRADVLSGASTRSIPLFTAGGGLLWRQCTKDYKIMPVRKKLRELVGPGGQAELWMGISQDEMQRAKLSSVGWITHRFPLLERRLSRLHCIEWLADHHYPTPSKSACTFCPYHDNASWRHMRANDPDSWAQAISFDAAVRNAMTQVKESVYVHRSLVPLAEADISDPAERQLSMLDECDGMCGV